jgi:DNA-binding MarR family transcriptional regulator
LAPARASERGRGGVAEQLLMEPSKSNPVLPTADDPAGTVFQELLRMFGLMVRVQRAHFARFGISEAQWKVLWNLHQAERGGDPGLHLADLSRRMLIRPPTVTGIVDRLEKSGLLLRRVEELDSRAKQVVLTAKGQRLVARVLGVHHGQIDDVMGALSALEQMQLDRLLVRLREHLASLAADDLSRV